MMRLFAASLGILICLGLGSVSAGEPPVVYSEAFTSAPPKSKLFHKEEKCGCWSHHNEFTCGSLKSECTFLFGSCRSFFGDPCVKVPKEHKGLFGC